jgi:hypothetical protein
VPLLAPASRKRAFHQIRETGKRGGVHAKRRGGGSLLLLLLLLLPAAFRHLQSYLTQRLTA